MSRRAFLARALAAMAAMATGQRVSAQALEATGRMAAGAPSATARGAALARALHQIVDHPRILDDPLALAMVDGGDLGELQASADRGASASRAFIALRSRYAEDRLGAAVDRGVRQYVVLGAGLDTYAYRNPHAARGLRVLEVDHPATQRWKRARLQAAGIAVPASTTYVPVDFETQTLAGELQRGGFRTDRPAFFSLLGVAIYLTEDAVTDTLRYVASCAAGSEIVFSFSLPDAHLSEAALARRERSRARMAAIGEPWLTFFEPALLVSRLQALGFGGVDILTADEANRIYFANRADGLKLGPSARMAAARV